MDQVTVNDLKNKGWVALECISGSRAYGLDTPESDTDIKGVFVLPKSEFYGLDYLEQVSNPSNDIVFYELKRFMELLAKNNPNLLELLATPGDSVLYKHPLMKRLKQEVFLSKLCQQSFGNYAMAQIKKARGLNKKILNPMEKERKSVLDFCYVVQEQGSIPLMDFLTNKGIEQQDCGISKVPHMHEVYGLYHEKGIDAQGIASSATANDINLSSIPKELKPIATMSFNKSGYSQYCKDYKEYWEWVENRNEARYENTVTHKKNYDAKNMMHTFRLLNMAEEIATEGHLNVKRPDRDFLLGIKNGAYDYEPLMQMADNKMKRVEEAFAKSALPEVPNLHKINALLIELRSGFY